MTTARADRLQGIEALRGIAAVLVVLVHTSSFIRGKGMYGVAAIGGAMNWGHAGVDLFFVISGFVITWAHLSDLGEPSRLGRYTWRRFARIYPTYWILMLVVVPLYFISPTATRYEQQPEVILFSLALIPQSGGPLWQVAWTLQYELVFYCLFGLAIFRPKLGLIAIVSIAVLAIAIESADPIIGKGWLPWSLNFLFDLYFLQFFAGLTAAWLVRKRSFPMPKVLLPAGIALLIAGGLIEVYGTLLENYDVRKIAYGFAAFLIIGSMAELNLRGVLAPPKFMMTLGGATYSVYLTHTLTLMILAKAMEISGIPAWLPRDIAYAILVVAATVAGVAYWYVIEQPVLQYFRKPFWVRDAKQEPAQSMSRAAHYTALTDHIPSISATWPMRISVYCRAAARTGHWCAQAIHRWTAPVIAFFKS